MIWEPDFEPPNNLDMYLAFIAWGFILAFLGLFVVWFISTPANAAGKAWLTPIITLDSGRVYPGWEVVGWHPREYPSMDACERQAKHAASIDLPRGVKAIAWACYPFDASKGRDA